MRKKFKWLSLAMAVVMTAGSLLTGCGNQGTDSGAAEAENAAVQETEAASVEQAAQEAEEEAPAVDTSEHVDLVFFQVGDRPAGFDAVEEKINEILLEKVNATLTFNFTTWTDFISKYDMALSGGEAADIVFTASWMWMYDYIDKGAFLELTELIDQYAPDLWSEIPEDILNQCFVDGKFYCIPSDRAESGTSGIMYREDLRKAYDLPVPDSLENLEAYMQGIKDNMPDQTVADPRAMIEAVMKFKYDGPTFDDWIKYGMISFYNNPAEWVDYWGTEDHLEDLQIIKKWADAGYWSKDALADVGVDPKTFFEAGETVLCPYGTQAGTYIDYKGRAERDHPDWEVGYVAFADINGVAWIAHPQKQGIAIGSNCENPERAMMVIDLLYTDPELNHLLLYGIEGEHYEVDENGYYVPGEKNADFAHLATNSWGFVNEGVSLPVASQMGEYKELQDHIIEIASKTKTPLVNIGDFFTGVITNTTADAALTAVMTEYLTPLNYGMVEDVEAGLQKFMEEAEKVGLRDLQEEYKALWTEYCEEKGY